MDRVGATDGKDPTRCLVRMLKSRRISNYYMKESIAFLRHNCMPTPRQIATAEAGGEPLPVDSAHRGPVVTLHGFNHGFHLRRLILAMGRDRVGP